MNIYIRGTGNISPQNTFDHDVFLEDIVEYHSNHLKCIEPNYRDFMQPAQLRRMSRILKMGVAAAGQCLKDADVETPDAIITGTGLGIMEETEKFLTSLIDNNERLLNPTKFIQSTHNTVGAHIAVMLKCNNYNFNFVNGSQSFENALLDSIMHLEDHPGDNVLLGTTDEMTDAHFKITGQIGNWKKRDISNLELLQSKDAGSIAGEGAAFFLLNDKPHKSNYAIVKDVDTNYKAEDNNALKHFISGFLERNELRREDLNLVILGLNGDVNYDKTYKVLMKEYFATNIIGYFKHLCGQYFTTSSFAFWLAANILKNQNIPPAILVDQKIKPETPVNNILVYNNRKNNNHSLMLLSSC